MKISVCIPTYNQGKYIAKAIESCLTQSRLPDEIIVSDDCSTDETSSILQDLAKNNVLVHLLHNTQNMGMGRNTDHVLRSAKGDFIVKLDSDDFLLPDYIKKLSQKLEEYPQAGYAHGAVQEIDQDDNPTVKRLLMRESGFQNDSISLKAAVKGYRVAANIIMFRRSALEAADYIQCPVNFAEDFYLSASIADKGFGNVYVSDILSCYRVWTDKQMVRQKRKLNEINGFRSVYELILRPAFVRRNWDTSVISQQCANIASDQADCLSMSYFDKNEKKELEKALLDLSNSTKVKRAIWLYQHGFGALLIKIKATKHKSKIWLKQLLKKK